MVEEVLVQWFGVYEDHIFDTMDVLISFLVKQGVRGHFSAHYKGTYQQQSYD